MQRLYELTNQNFGFVQCSLCTHKSPCLLLLQTSRSLFQDFKNIYHCNTTRQNTYNIFHLNPCLLYTFSLVRQDAQVCHHLVPRSSQEHKVLHLHHWYRLKMPRRSHFRSNHNMAYQRHRRQWKIANLCYMIMRVNHMCLHKGFLPLLIPLFVCHIILTISYSLYDIESIKTFISLATKPSLGFVNNLTFRSRLTSYNLLLRQSCPSWINCYHSQEIFNKLKFIAYAAYDMEHAILGYIIYGI